MSQAILGMIMNKLKNQTVLITGGTGSFGKTMLSHLLAKGVGKVKVLSRDEEKQDALRNRLKDCLLYTSPSPRDRG